MTSQSYKRITFPEEEIPILKKQDRIITTRVSRQFTKFNRGDKVITSWGAKFKITNIKKFTKVEDHPYYKHLTKDQIKLISRYPNLAVLTLEKINETYNEDNNISEFKNIVIDEVWNSKTPRSELPNSKFGLPKERKFPLDSEQHVRSAIKLFGHANENNKKLLARRIKSAANKYNITIPENTQCYKYLHENDNILIDEDQSYYILVRNYDDTLTKMNINEFSDITLNNKNDIKYPSINSAIMCLPIQEEEYSVNVYGKYNDNILYLGEVNVNSDSYSWNFQETLLKDSNDKLYNISNNEMSLNNINPIIGMNNKMHYLIYTPIYNNFIYTNDPSSEKGLIINKNNILEVTTIDPSIEINGIYKFIGNESYIRRLERLYNKQYILPENTNLYTLLSGKKMLSEDQIEYDNLFKKLNFDLLEQKIITNLVTFRDQVINLSNNRDIVMPVIDAFISVNKPDYFDKYNTCKDICIKEDMDGYFYYSDITKKRCQSMPNIKSLTENMLISIL